MRRVALLYLASAALWLYVAAFHADTGATRSAVAAGLALAVGVVHWALSSRFRAWMLHMTLSACVGGTALVLAQASTTAGAMLCVAGLLWIAAYVGVHYRPRTGRVYGAYLALSLGGGLLASSVPSPIEIWIPFAITLVGTIEALSRTTSRLRADAMTDPLTGLLNRNGLGDASRRAISTCRRAGVPLTVAQIDLDDFKQVNDSDGHAEGDRLLQLCADAWQRDIRASDILARVGGDEFVLVLPGSNRALAEETLRRLQSHSPAGWSYGTAELEPGEDDIDGCLIRADARLYEAKAARRRQGTLTPSRASLPRPSIRRRCAAAQPTMRTGVPRGRRRAIQLT